MLFILAEKYPEASQAYRGLRHVAGEILQYGNRLRTLDIAETETFTILDMSLSVAMPPFPFPDVSLKVLCLHAVYAARPIVQTTSKFY